MASSSFLVFSSACAGLILRGRLGGALRGLVFFAAGFRVDLPAALRVPAPVPDRLAAFLADAFFVDTFFDGAFFAAVFLLAVFLFATLLFAVFLLAAFLLATFLPAVFLPARFAAAGLRLAPFVADAFRAVLRLADGLRVAVFFAVFLAVVFVALLAALRVAAVLRGAALAVVRVVLLAVLLAAFFLAAGLVFADVRAFFAGDLRAVLFRVALLRAVVVAMHSSGRSI